MLPSDKAMDRSLGEPGLGRPIGFRRPERRMHWARMGLLGLALWVSSGATGCGDGGGPGSPESKEKQEVVQDKMKEFMKKSKLPNKPG